jgi:hypothetical protein
LRKTEESLSKAVFIKCNVMIIHSTRGMIFLHSLCVQIWHPIDQKQSSTTCHCCCKRRHSWSRQQFALSLFGNNLNLQNLFERNVKQS